MVLLYKIEENKRRVQGSVLNLFPLLSNSSIYVEAFHMQSQSKCEQTVSWHLPETKISDLHDSMQACVLYLRVWVSPLHSLQLAAKFGFRNRLRFQTSPPHRLQTFGWGGGVDYTVNDYIHLPRSKIRLKSVTCHANSSNDKLLIANISFS